MCSQIWFSWARLVLLDFGAGCLLTRLYLVLFLTPAALAFRGFPRPRCNHAFSGISGRKVISMMILCSWGEY
ncbi:hypothetical protein B0H16DRAFT_1500032 [Mycena metata]|uniref:Uncharacterized protein n=1 Tax=Mycena metata TaxID=1033252 RepID=A0AAD7K9I3_9AGAR|nr:hypothetical protein B0H16DRAFT_1500032 [Mycena metata]